MFEKYRIDFLPNDLKAVKIVASWIYYAFHVNNPNASVETIFERLEPHVEFKSLPLTLVASDLQGNPVGTVSLIEDDFKSRPDLSPWLAALYVAPEVRKEGVGSLLVNRAIEESRRLKYDKIYLVTLNRQQFYRNLGWFEIARENSDQGDEMTVMMFSNLQ